MVILVSGYVGVSGIKLQWILRLHCISPPSAGCYGLEQSNFPTMYQAWIKSFGGLDLAVGSVFGDPCSEVRLCGSTQTYTRWISPRKGVRI